MNVTVGTQARDDVVAMSRLSLKTGLVVESVLNESDYSDVIEFNYSRLIQYEILKKPVT